jgi:predicted DNA-binding transcriptional regulator AlpA
MENLTLIRMPEVQRLCGGVSRPTVYRWQRCYGFPRGGHLGEKTKVWNKVDVLQWISKRMKEAA